MSTKDSSGSYSIGKSTSYKCGWRVQRKYWTDGKPRMEIIPIDAWPALGFDFRMTIDQARSRAKQLNASNSLEREAIRKAALRVAKLELTESALLPQHLVEEFETLLLGRRGSSDRHKRKMLTHWKKLKTIILDLQLEPSQYVDNKEKIYDWFIEREVSLEYALKLIGMLNQWGDLNCRRQSAYFKAVPMPKGRDRQMIADTYYDSEGFRGESSPLTPQMLDAKRDTLKEPQYKWLAISLWFGLRPYEVDNLKTPDPKLWRIVRNDLLGVDVLEIYQSKLTAVPRDKRWKRIPVFHPKQIEALEYIKAGDFKKPLVKVMPLVFDTGRITFYGGRKGFEGLMTELGQDLREIASWMGHQSIERTWTKYRDRDRVAFNRVDDKKPDKVG
jgi:integrase